jgi:hypothetical protein
MSENLQRVSAGRGLRTVVVKELQIRIACRWNVGALKILDSTVQISTKRQAILLFGVGVEHE